VVTSVIVTAVRLPQYDMISPISPSSPFQAQRVGRIKITLAPLPILSKIIKMTAQPNQCCLVPFLAPMSSAKPLFLQCNVLAMIAPAGTRSRLPRPTTRKTRKTRMMKMTKMTSNLLDGVLLSLRFIDMS